MGTYQTTLHKRPQTVYCAFRLWILNCNMWVFIVCIRAKSRLLSTLNPLFLRRLYHRSDDKPHDLARLMYGWTSAMPPCISQSVLSALPLASMPKALPALQTCSSSCVVYFEVVDETKLSARHACMASASPKGIRGGNRFVWRIWSLSSTSICTHSGVKPIASVIAWKTTGP